MKLHEKLQALRESQGLTKMEIAGRAGISRQGYDNIESGESRPNIDTLAGLAQAFGVSVADLLDDPTEGVA